MEARKVEISGVVIEDQVNRGSKSDHLATLLRAEDGTDYVLSRRDGPSFGDTLLKSLVGSTITARGVAIGDTLIMSEWTARSE